MLPLPKILNTSKLPARDELEMLRQEIISLNCVLINTNTLPRTANSLYVYQNGVIVSTSGIMWGSSFNTQFTFDSNYHFAYRHAFPTPEIYQFYVNNPTYPSFMRQEGALNNFPTMPNFPAVNRNGYASSSYGSYSGVRSDLFVYWDDAQQRVMQYNPSINSVPTFRYN